MKDTNKCLRCGAEYLFDSGCDMCHECICELEDKMADDEADARKLYDERVIESSINDEPTEGR